MDNKFFLTDQNEKPLDRIVEGYSRTSVFRRMAFIGDSLSSGEFETLRPDGKHGYHDLFEYSWGQYIARKNGLLAYNFSRGGMTAKQYMESFAEQKGYWDPELWAQAYVIALGVNDIYNKGLPLGDMTDVCDGDHTKNGDTFVGHYAAIIQRYKLIRPDAKFFLLTLPKITAAGKAEKTPAVNAAIRAMAEHFDNTYLIDLYEYGPVYDESFRERFYLHGHMTPDGYIFTAQMVDSYIDYIVRHNPEDFKHIGFVGSGIQYKFD